MRHVLRYQGAHMWRGRVLFIHPTHGDLHIMDDSSGLSASVSCFPLLSALIYTAPAAVGGSGRSSILGWEL